MEIRPTTDNDRLALARIFASVAEERDGIATEPPVDVEARAAGWILDGDFLAEIGGEPVGLEMIHVERSKHGFGEIGMAVLKEWRGRGVGSALLGAAIECPLRGVAQAEPQRLPTTRRQSPCTASVGFVEEGRLVKHYRRQSGEFWDAIQMGLLLED